MQEVDSSQIESRGYDATTKTLRVKFRRTPEPYDYFDVPAEKWAEFLEADSPGRFLATEIKGTFDFKKLEKEEPDGASDGVG